LDWFPLGHAHSQYAQPGWSFLYFADLTSHAFLPAISIVLATLGGWILGMRNTMIATLNQDYVSLAKARGLSPTRVVFRYAARNALLPNLTSFGMALGFVLSGSLLTEIVFSYPGQGYLLVQAVRNQDFPLMQGIFLLITLGVLFANWCVDLVYLVLNPEARRST
jgi:peptide/nickel transport system permease protein